MLSGCATTPGQCDPSHPDFFNNVSCLTSGAYSQRQRDLESTLSAERSRNEIFQALLADLRAEQAAVGRDLRSKQASLQRADATWRQLKGGLAAETRASPALAARVRQIDDDFAAVEAGKVAERDALANRVALLQQELDAGIYD
jgi:chromosome segregation ATPase